jgi:RNA polymerase sigma-70 factor (ECF subfamily)
MPQQSSFIPCEPCGLSYGDLRALNDEIVMAHLAAGHGDAITVLFDRYGRLVLRIGLKILRDRGEGEDLTQEVFADLCRTAGRFDSAKGTTKMWITRGASRRALNRRRYLNLRNLGFPRGVVEDASEICAEAQASIVPAMSIPDARRLTAQMLAMTEAAQRKVLELVFFEGLTMNEVAELTGDSLGSVRHRYYRGLQKMRRVLTEQKSGETSASPATETIDAKA